jgi:endo-1,4-beta-xylanase
MDAAAAKFANVDFVDVVNEALHAKPSYRNAIGGDGSTGWDWVIWSFQEARKRFKGKLLINEYGVENDPNAAAQYIKIINLLKDRGLVDGIGLQCHQFNLDTTSASTLKSVLNSFAATGLPIYVSELDLTGDDNTQLNRYKEKFPIYYEHSSVKGITLWGWIQNQTWKEGTYLITSSGQERPALKWLKEYLASVGPSNTPTPTKAPTPTPTKSATPTPTKPAGSIADLNGDSVVNMSDVIELAKAFGAVRGDARYKASCDLNNDGAINMADVLIIAGEFNKPIIQ